MLYPVLRHMKFEPRLPLIMENAIDEIDYGVSIQVHFLIKEKFWEKDGLPSSIWTDGPMERFAVLFRRDDDEATSAISFVNGNEAYKYDYMTDEQVVAYTLHELERIRPSTKGAVGARRRTVLPSRGPWSRRLGILASRPGYQIRRQHAGPSRQCAFLRRAHGVDGTRYGRCV